MLGWTLLCAMAVVGGGSGLLASLWQGRFWYIYALVSATLHETITSTMSHLIPRKTPILAILPDVSLEGISFGVISCFLFFTLVSLLLHSPCMNSLIVFIANIVQSVAVLLENPWCMQVPISMSMIPFDAESSKLADGPLYEKGMSSLLLPEMLGSKQINFIASDFMLHLFVITLFIAFVAPFAAYLFYAVKQAAAATLHSESKKNPEKSHLFSRSVDMLLVTGCFMLFYINSLDYSNEIAQQSYVLAMVEALSPSAQQELY